MNKAGRNKTLRFFFDEGGRQRERFSLRRVHRGGRNGHTTR
ncbi:hypothetical protein GS8_2172 [Geobacillus stearothermophilus]|uniref:Uncharacterized protein n=1 Tax=Geobacillus stearothermophilus TaxID=1422 RepID=A0ABQ7HCU5_GEOSE|nr:hypothetical protein GS8_2172 [Geobacillus stearothermophilus]